MTETVKTYQNGRETEHEVVTYVDITFGCCVVRVQGFDDRDPKDAWRWVNIDLLSTHEPWMLSWRKRLAYAWHTVRYGTACREFIEIVREDEMNQLIDAMRVARDTAFAVSSPDKATVTQTADRE